MLPFPNDLYTKADPSTKTGRRVDFSLLAMPRNARRQADRPDRPEPRRRLQPGLDDHHQDRGPRRGRAARRPRRRRASGTPSASLRRRRARSPSSTPTPASSRWSGPSSTTRSTRSAPRPADRVLIVRPAKNFLEGHRYIVALRLGAASRADPTFAAYRDKGAALTNPFDEQRRAHFEDLFTTLDAAGIERDDAHPGLGLHRRLGRQHRRPDAAHPRRRLRASSATPTSAT